LGSGVDDLAADALKQDGAELTDVAGGWRRWGE
jgi:hypothetical protein